VSRRAAITLAPNRSSSRLPRRIAAAKRRSNWPSVAYEGKRTEGRRTLTLLLMADGANPTAQRCAARAMRPQRAGDAQSHSGTRRRGAGRPARIPRGELFEKYNKAEAAKSFQEALKANPEYGSRSSAWRRRSLTRISRRLRVRRAR
jgi:hypothetical protein